ncbi:metallophosphoesterase [Planktotalea sp.]|uniref:metallophosphoesterase n=1 Tax=Planktotalea sp. TaxID=2029877 RepID=UPI00329A3D77
MGKLLWFSDLHFEASGTQFGYEPCARLDALTDYITAHHADAEICIISGDMVETANAENYQELASRLARLGMRYLPMTGNHDERALFRNALPLPENTQDDFIQYAITVDGLRLICLDTLTTGSGDGSFCTARREWLAAELKRDTVIPTLVFCHHPPLPLGYPVLDRSRVPEETGLLNLLTEAPNLRHLLMGHVHRPMLGTVKDLPFASIRSVLYQAPPPIPAWDWDSFKPAHEAPDLGVLTYDNDVLRLQFEPFCTADTGFIPQE